MTNDITAWLNKLRAVAKQDPRKTGFLAILGAVLLVMLGRAMLGGGSGPARAAGSAGGAVAEAAGRAASVPGARTGESENVKTNNTNLRLREWLNEPIKPVSRNLFAVKLDYFPTEGGRAAQGVKTAADGEFWGRLEKSLMLQADQRDKRENLLANFRAEAATLKLDSIMMGANPKAMIDGKLVAEGDVVASFRVLKIEPRRIVVEREGIRLEILMK